jgi:hypothetical protein
VIHYRIDDVEMHADEGVMTGDGTVVRVTWTLNVRLLAQGDADGTAGVILTDLETRLAGDDLHAKVETLRWADLTQAHIAWNEALDAVLALLDRGTR